MPVVHDMKPCIEVGLYKGSATWYTTQVSSTVLTTVFLLLCGSATHVLASSKDKIYMKTQLKLSSVDRCVS
jgi:hypothetical protein